ncbi:DUF262 domain-containing HNH endonuclease family protein [Microbacterium lacus]|uniref:DUF262 domain-containing protein n=1 Tax=Microbacterium lacus TaxID=415217 RepID=UPI003850807B
MATATNIDATAVGTAAWLSDSAATIIVPVYQRQYRWDIGGCEQLLADVRAVADSDPQHMHFIGSILSSLSADGTELVLIDGQQRLTTIMLLVAALHHTVRSSDAALAAELERVIVAPGGGTRLRPHEAWAGIFESVIFDRRPEDGSLRDSRFDDNYAFFRSQVSLEEAPRVWRGLQKLEHVAITLGAGANAQQIFASLNSTGEPLRDHELIHNYVLMGLSHAEQTEIEETFWLPIEQLTGNAIGSFWRHFLMMVSGRELSAGNDHTVYSEFRERFPVLDAASLRVHAAFWLECAEAYRVMLEPERAPDDELVRQLRYVNTFGRGMYPLVMRTYLDWRHGVVDRATLLGTLEHVQSLLLRREVVGLPSDRLVARLARAHAEGRQSLWEAMGRITPSDERVRIALKYNDLPHPAYVLSRIAGRDSPEGFDVDHIVPLSPGATWSGDGTRSWSEYSDDEQNSHRALSRTIGNLALLEVPLAERTFDESYPRKRDEGYAHSAVESTREIAHTAAWSTGTIAHRAAVMTERFVDVWKRAAIVGIDDDGLTPILDAILRRGWPPGWEFEFAYIEYRGEHWEVPDVKYLFNRIFKRLWADSRSSVLAYSDRHGGPVYRERAWNGHWDALDEGHNLYMGWDSRYMLTAIQGVLDEAGIAPEVFVKYSYIGAAM